MGFQLWLMACSLLKQCKCFKSCPLGWEAQLSWLQVAQQPATHQLCPVSASLRQSRDCQVDTVGEMGDLLQAACTWNLLGLTS